MAKSISYYQVMKVLSPNFMNSAADDQKAWLQELLQSMENYQSIENLFIDIQMVFDFVQQDQLYVQSQFQVIVHLQNLFIEIQNEGLGIDMDQEEQNQFVMTDGTEDHPEESTNLFPHLSQHLQLRSPQPN